MTIRHSELTFMNEDNLELRSNKKKKTPKTNQVYEYRIHIMWHLNT